MIACEHCQKEVDETDRRALTVHYWTHRIGGPGLIIKYFHGGVPPVCACGCGEATGYDKRKQAFGEYRQGHDSWKRRVVEGTATANEAPEAWRPGKRGTLQEPNPVIYSITNQVTNKQYVGLDSCWPRRRNYHLSMLRRGKHYNRMLQNSFTKHGESSFVFRVLEQVEPGADIATREQHWIQVLDTYTKGYNMSLGGEGTNSHRSRHERRSALAALAALLPMAPVVEKKDGRKVGPKEDRIVKQTQVESYDDQGNPRCVSCSMIFTDKNVLIHHYWHKHRVNGPVTIMHFYHGGVVALCECGCGEAVRYSPSNQRYNPFTNGHNGRGNARTVETIQKLQQTRRENKAKGLYEPRVASAELRAVRSQNAQGQRNSNSATQRAKRRAERA